ncbi:NAD(P)-dependent alcohol dehydrogenase [Actinomadura sp. HBU206391]|uniref:NAD(P)-dependent alcohol dehydrogenase n=1 Tax=Actinomadura sp. HBU206391 TaxID=2731692 RepID=UPI00164F2DA6|nr:NAD(P)-dependent alcohol dehydrogenase [Actinomadura sp. HBU206391]MBC6460039.1 NAD(P)-dependent alcohol dehydrogenase [Actinomadura sp. HBU206391]
MKAIVQDAYGSADVLELRDIDRPVPADDEVLVQVHAAGVGPDVWHLMTGLPYAVRLFAGLRKPRNPVRGQDAAGRVEAVGAKVTRFKPGDEVFGVCEGSFAEYARAKADKLAPKPRNLSFEQAAALPISGITAFQVLRDKGRPQPGRQVLIIGASGGIGTLAVQLAAGYDAKVTGVCGPGKADLIRSLGATDVIDYTSEDITGGARRYDVILDIAGNRPLSVLRRALAPHGTLVLVGGENGDRWLGGLDRSLRALLLSPFLRQTLRGHFSRERHQDLLVLKDLAESGELTPVVDRTYPLGEAAAAMRHLEDGHPQGKIVVSVTDGS